MEALKVREHMDSWNDDRLDELARGVQENFRKVEERFDRVDQEMKAGFAKADQKIDAGFANVDQKFERLYHLLFGGMVVIVGALIGVPALGG